MSLFEDVGRTVERVKQSVTGEDDYRCADCGATFDVDHDHCPDCGAAAVEPVEGDDDA
jgi:rRNA maturation endonuclease Nob1